MEATDGKRGSSTLRLRSNISKWTTDNLKEPNVDDVVASVIQPCGKTKKVKMYLNEDLTYSVAFLPKEVGTHQLNVVLSNQHIPGSPFDFNVVALTPGGHEKFFAAGSGLKKAIVNERATFHVMTSECGEGKLEVSIHGPSKADISYLDKEDGTAEVSYLISESGKYNLHIKFDGRHIIGSPYEAVATGKGQDDVVELQMVQYSDASKIEAIGDGLKTGKVREKVSFQIDCSKSGSNVLIAGIVGPSGPCEDIVVKERNGKRYEVVYVPEEIGEFVIVLKWGDDDVQGCPFRALIS